MTQTTRTNPSGPCGGRSSYGDTGGEPDPQRVVTLSLADLFWKSVRESEDVEGLIALERDHSFQVAERQVNQYLSDRIFGPCATCCARRRRSCRLTHARSSLFTRPSSHPAPIVFPRCSKQLHRSFHTPTVLFYPGTWSHTLNYMGLRSDDQALGSYRVKIYGRES